LHSIEGENGSLWRWFRARRLMQIDGSAKPAGLAEAQRLTNEVESRRPAWPDAYLLRGLLDERLGNASAAMDAYRKSLKLGERRVAASERLIALLYQSNQFAEASQILSQYQQSSDRSEGMSSLAIAVSLRQQEVDRAIGLAKSWVQKHPNDSTGYLRLGQTLF